MEREGFTHPAADRRRHDLAGPHRGQDRAALPGPDRPRARRVARGRRGGQPAERHAARRLRRGRARGVRDDARAAEPSGPRGAAPAASRRRGGTGWPSTGAARRRRCPASLGVTVLDDYPLDELVAADRLDAVLPDLGAAGPLSRRSSTDPDAWAAAATSLFRDAQALLDRIVAGAAARRARGVFGFFRANARRRRHRALRRRGARREPLGRHPHAPAADAQAAGPAQPRARRLRGAARDAASPTTSAPSR